MIIRDQQWFRGKRTQTHSQQVFHPLKCHLCKKIIEIGSRYYGDSSFHAHDTCVDA